MELAETGRLLSGRYRLRAVVGRGGMGVVWEARDELLNRDVAVKELIWPPHLTEAEQRTACSRTVREAQMAARLAHPNVVRIYDIVEEDGHPWIITNWEQQAANRASTYPDYHLIRLASVSYPQAEKAADWEFTYVRDGIPVHILNRNVLANAQHAYALYWSTPESDWNADYHYFQAFADTFRPDN